VELMIVLCFDISSQVCPYVSTFRVGETEADVVMGLPFSVIRFKSSCVCAYGTSSTVSFCVIVTRCL
jgi:hypothetical protein